MWKTRSIKSSFFDRNSIEVSKDLLGKYLVRRIGKKTLIFKIIETEAYEGPDDKASHASRGKTPRNIPMFGNPGTIYVYFTYGIHWMLNIVCGKKGHPAAVLIRAIEGYIGPGRLTKKLKVNKLLNGKPLGKKTRLWIIEEVTSAPVKLNIIKTPRIGVEYAGKWAKKLYRFVLKEEFK